MNCRYGEQEKGLYICEKVGIEIKLRFVCFPNTGQCGRLGRRLFYSLV